MGDIQAFFRFLSILNRLICSFIFYLLLLGQSSKLWTDAFPDDQQTECLHSPGKRRLEHVHSRTNGLLEESDFDLKQGLKSCLKLDIK
jgi:hypothetical protein